MSDHVARVFRTQWLEWWAELWVPRSTARQFVRCPGVDGWPDPIEGYERVGLKMKSTRRGAETAARRMADRHAQGLHPEHDKPVPILVDAENELDDRDYTEIHLDFIDGGEWSFPVGSSFPEPPSPGIQ